MRRRGLDRGRRSTSAALSHNRHVVLAARCDWELGPELPPSPDGTVHVWWADLSSAELPLTQMLCASERERAARLLSEHRRELWARSRAVLRDLLGRYLQREPAAITISSGSRGKPQLADAELFFNLSHSGNVALYAFSRMGSVGVDVEVAARRAVDEVAIAARVLGEHQAQRLREISGPRERQLEFLRAWTRHEAALKCAGVGLFGAGVADGHTREPWLAQLELASGQQMAAALACERRPRELRCWRWCHAGGSAEASQRHEPPATRPMN